MKNGLNLIEIFKNSLEIEKLEIKAQSLKTKGTPAIITINEYQRRINDMNRIYGDMFGMSNEKAQETLIINTANDIVRSLIDFETEDQKLLCRHIYDLALISQRRLTASELEGFIERSVAVMGLIE